MPRKIKKQTKNRQPKRPTGRKGMRGDGQGSISQGQIQQAPAAIGHVAPRAFLKRGGKAQQVTDQDPLGSERISGCDLFATAIKSGSSTPAAGFGGTGTYWLALTPSAISSRLAAIEEMFQWYVIRRLKVMYTPTCGTNTTGSVAVGISTDDQINAAFASPTQQQVMELQPAMLSPVWGFSSMEMHARGTKLFESYASGESGDTRNQCAIAAVMLGGVASTVYGQLWLDYDIDFYQQVPLISGVDLFRLGRACPRCHQKVVSDPLLFKRSPRYERKELPDRDDEFVVLRTSESQQDSALSPVYQGLERPVLRREETKAQSSTRSLSLKG